MLRKLHQFIEQKHLFEKGDKILLAVSGGIDSMVMLDLFIRSKLNIGVAHCNFQLRGEDSLQDEQFVKNRAAQYGIDLYTNRFSTMEYANLHKISTQMAARELRYAWFEEVREQNGFAFIATAHHLDDQVETFFINLLRGTGIAGLHGILPKQEKIIRPLLFATRHEIATYAAQNDIPFREDASNSEDYYLRNKIRHHILPQFHELNPGFNTSLNGTIERLRASEMVFRTAIEQTSRELIDQHDGRNTISIHKLHQLTPLELYLYELLSPFGFNESNIKSIHSALHGEPGKQFFSSTHRLIKDRDVLIILPIETSKGFNAPPEVYIETSDQEITNPLSLKLECLPRREIVQIDPSPTIATLDASKLIFPLLLRKWQKGDFFYPYGKMGKKKLSDFFIDEKLTLEEKERCWLLVSDDAIAWVVGYRIDHRFRVTKSTKEVIQIKVGD